MDEINGDFKEVVITQTIEDSKSDRMAILILGAVSISILVVILGIFLLITLLKLADFIQIAMFVFNGFFVIGEGSLLTIAIRLNHNRKKGVNELPKEYIIRKIEGLSAIHKMRLDNLNVRKDVLKLEKENNEKNKSRNNSKSTR
jgi:hypothetical protein